MPAADMVRCRAGSAPGWSGWPSSKAGRFRIWRCCGWCSPGAVAPAPGGDSAFTAPAVYLQDLSSIIGGLLALAGLTAGYLASSPVPVLTGPWSCK